MGRALGQRAEWSGGAKKAHSRERYRGNPSLAVFRGGVRSRAKRKPASLGGKAILTMQGSRPVPPDITLRLTKKQYKGVDNQKVTPILP